MNRSIARGFALGTGWVGAVLLSTALVGLPAARAQEIDQQEFEIDIDYYLLNFFNQINALPRDLIDYDGDGSISASERFRSANNYSILNLFAPAFFFINHDLDFNTPRRDVRSNALGGTGVSWVRGASALSLNPAGMATGSGGGFYIGAGSRSGSGQSGFTEDFVVDTGIVGNIDPLEQTFDTRMWLNHNGLYLSGHPFHSAENPRGALGRLALGFGYRRFLDMYNGSDFLTHWLPEDGIGGLTAEIVTGAQSREKGGVDAVVVGAATSIGNEDSAVRLNIGANANFASGRIQADQVYTVSLLTQIVQELPGDIVDNAFVRQKFEATAFDFGVQAGLLSDQLTLGAVYRPAYTLEMTSGKFVNVGGGANNALATVTTRGAISPYDLEVPASLTAGGTLALRGLLGTGEERTGFLGMAHRFFGRGHVSVEYSSQKLSEATVEQRKSRLSNPELEDQFEALNIALGDAFPGMSFDFTPNIPLHSGDALLSDKTSIHVGYETPLLVRDDWNVDVRFGYETVPLAFPGLVLGEATLSENGVFEQVPTFNADGTPITEDVEGDAISLGFGFSTGMVDFDVTFRRLGYDFVAYWNGTTGAQPFSWYDFLDDTYTEIPGVANNQTTAARISPSVTSVQLGATLRF